MSQSIAPISQGFAPASGGATSSARSSNAAPFAGSEHGHDTFAGSAAASKKGSSSSLGLITGAMACCAIVPFFMGMLVIGGVSLAARRAFKGINHMHPPVGA